MMIISDWKIEFIIRSLENIIRIINTKINSLSPKIQNNLTWTFQRINTDKIDIIILNLIHCHKNKINNNFFVKKYYRYLKLYDYKDIKTYDTNIVNKGIIIEIVILLYLWNNIINDKLS